MYKTPLVLLMQCSNLNIAETAGRICYDSFNKTTKPMSEFPITKYIPNINEYNGIDYLDKLANVYFHSSVTEHLIMTFYIEGLSRGVLMQLSRHRIASFSVRSTRYTMSDLLIITYLTYKYGNETNYNGLKDYIYKNILVLADKEEANIEAEFIIRKLVNRFNKNNIKITDLLGKEQLKIFNDDKDNILKALHINEVKYILNKLKQGKGKRNLGDDYKDIVSDNWGTNLFFTINMRSFINFYKLRSKNSAWAPIRVLAKEMYNLLPYEYKYIINKKDIDELSTNFNN